MNADPRLTVKKHQSVKLAASKKSKRSETEPKQATITPLEILLTLEGGVRAVPNYDGLGYFMCNETFKLIKAGQIMFFRPGYREDKWQMHAASSISSIDRNAPLVNSIEKFVSDLTHSDTVTSFKVGDSIHATDIHFTNGMMALLAAPSGQVLGRLVFFRDSPFNQSEEVLVSRIAGAYGHALSFFSKAKRSAKKSRYIKLGFFSAAILCLLASFIPVPMSVLAPVEVVARDPKILTAPMDGVISAIDVEPNHFVEEGQSLVRFNDTDLLGRLDVTQRNLEVAVARNRRVIQGASLSQDMRREMLVTQSELAVAQAERDEAKAAYERTKLLAPQSGVAIFASKDDWVGRPVATGERVMEIGDPERLEFRVDVNIGDSIVLDKGADVRVFLHNDPLNAIDAQFIGAGFRAEETADNKLAYRVKAQLFDEADGRALRIGLRGTARISKGNVSLGYYLFRKPISTFRQWVGL